MGDMAISQVVMTKEGVMAKGGAVKKSTFVLIDESGKEIFRTTSLNKASDTRHLYPNSESIKIDKIEPDGSRRNLLANGGMMAKQNTLKEGDYVWNAVGKKLVVDKVTKGEYYLSVFGQFGASPFLKSKIHSYIKSGKWTLKPKMATGGMMDSKDTSKLVYDRDKYNKLLSEYNKIGAFLEDATSESERAKYKKQLDEIESKIHRHERNYEKGGMMLKGGKIPYIVYVTPKGKTGREFYKEYSSMKASEKAIDELMMSGKYSSVGNVTKERYEKYKTFWLERGGMMAKGGTVLSNAKKKVAKMTDDEVVQEISTIYHYDMADNDVDMEELYNDIDTARKELIKHYAEEGEDIPSGYFAKGGSVKKKPKQKHDGYKISKRGRF